MALEIQNIKPNRIYRNMKILVPQKKEEGTVLFYISRKDNCLDFINKNTILRKKDFTAYYIPNSYDRNGIKKYFRNVQLEKLELIRDNTDYVKRGKKDPSKLNNRNLFFDLSMNIQYHDKYFRGGDILKTVDLFQYTNELIQSFGNGYTKKVIVIDTDESLESGFLYSFFEMIKLNKLSADTFNGLDIVLRSDKFNLMVKLNGPFTKSNLPRLIRLKNIIFKLELGEELNEEELNELKMEDESEINKNSDLKETLTSVIRNTFNANPKVEALTNVQKKIISDMEDKIDDIIDKEEGADFSEIGADGVLDELEEDKEYLKYASELANSKTVLKQNKQMEAKLDRIKSLQSKLELNGISFNDVLNDFREKAIDVEEIPIKDAIFEEVKYSKLRDFEVSYSKKEYKKDLIKVLTAFNDNPDIPVYVTKANITNSSDEFSQKETLEVTLEDGNGTSHNLKIDLPKLIDDRFLYLNGGKKSITKQLTLLPVAKTKSDTVQCSSNYQKLFLIRFGQKMDPTTEKIKKFFTADTNELRRDAFKIKTTLGDNSEVNKKYITTLLYSEFEKFLMDLSINGFTFIFDLKRIKEVIIDSKVLDIIYDEINKDIEYPIAFNAAKNQLFVENVSDNKVYVYKNQANGVVKEEFAMDLNHAIIDLMDKVNPEGNIYKVISTQSAGTRFIYTRASVLGRKIPLVVLLASQYGFSKVLEKSGVSFKFSETKMKMSEEEKLSWSMIPFKDGFLYYKNERIRDNLLFNGITVINTTEYNFLELDEKLVYLDYFEDSFGSRNVSKGINNFMTLFIDPITKEVLKDLKLPENMLELLIYGNSLLEDSHYKELNDMSQYRIRSTELINAYLFRILADQFKMYKDNIKSGLPIKITLPQDKLLKELLESQLIEG